MGRFFIALIGQAIQERAVIRERMRRSTFIYVDEAHDYFDDNLEHLFNQLRKYRAGLIVAHQNLGQLSGRLRNTMMANTKIKMVGGLSETDAVAFSCEMQCGHLFLMQQKKARDWTSFAVRIKNHGDCASYKIPFGMLEHRRQLTQEAYDEARLGSMRAGTPLERPARGRASTNRKGMIWASMSCCERKGGNHGG